MGDIGGIPGAITARQPVRLAAATAKMHNCSAPTPANDGGQYSERVMGIARAFQAVHDEYDGSPLAERPVQIQKIAVG
jgi:hypothetical protein